jgi:Domain of unknown function (DUF6817)
MTEPTATRERTSSYREGIADARIAQTNIQLYNQLQEADAALEDLVLVRRAYDLASSLYSGYYQADGKPFVAHGVGVASAVALLGQPAEIQAVGLLHNAYGNGDFGDGRGFGITPSRRSVVRDAVGRRVDELLVRFQELRLRPGTIDAVRRALPTLDASERSLVIVELADHLEKHVDGGFLFFGENDWVVETTERIGGSLIEIARELGEPLLAEMLADGFAATAERAGSVPTELRQPFGQRYLKLVVPRSCRRRIRPLIRSTPRLVRNRVRARTRLRQLVSRAHASAR